MRVWRLSQGEDDGQDVLNGNSVHLRLGWGLISTGGVLRKRSARNGGPPFTLLEALSRDLCQARHLTKAQSTEAGLALSAVSRCTVSCFPVHCQLEATSPALGRRPLSRPELAKLELDFVIPTSSRRALELEPFIACEQHAM